jgi:hypothetical protein
VRPGRRYEGMLSTLVKAVVVAAVAALVIESIPDIKRYLEMRDMLGTSSPSGARFATPRY